MRKERPWRRYGLDAALAVGVAVLVMADALLGATRLTALDSVLLLAGTLVLAARRRAPRMVLLISLVLILAYALRVGPGPVSAAPLLIAIYTVVSAGHRVTALSAAVPLMAFVLASNLAQQPEGQWLPRSAQEAILPLGWFVPDASGRWWRGWRAASPTTRSRSSWSSARPRPGPTSAGRC